VFGPNVPLDHLEAFYDPNGGRSYARLFDYNADRMDFSIRRYRLEKEGLARAKFTRFDGEVLPISIQERIWRFFDDSSMSRGSWFAFIISAFLAFLGFAT